MNRNKTIIGTLIVVVIAGTVLFPANFLVDGGLDARSSNSENIALQPCFFDDISFTSAIRGDNHLRPGASDFVVFSDDNWGAGKDFYISQIVIKLNSHENDDFLANANEGVLVDVHDGGTLERIYYISFDRLNFETIEYNGHHVLYFTHDFPQSRKVTQLEVYISNASSVKIEATIFISGIAN